MIKGALDAAGVYSTQIEDKVRKGIPDLYVDGGVWVECKHLILVARGRGTNVLGEFSTHQKTRLVRPGSRDLNLAAFLMTTPKGEAAFFICRFDRLYGDREEVDDMRRLWTFKKAREWGVSCEDAPDYVRAVLVDRWQGANKHLDMEPEWPAYHLMGYYRGRE